ncbi:MAG: hypothetical protein KBT27_03530 [Prevotellaceae bacterium]|nr:hypothetical protein [Candidatus Faecinaster equi]
MLKITIPGDELWDALTEEFIYTDPIEITMEHSLLSLSKWEEEHEKPYLNNEKNISPEELLDYLRKMTITKNVPPEAFLRLGPNEISQIKAYIDRPHTATKMAADPNKHGNGRYAPKEIVTSEMIYYWMIELNIPIEFQKWNLNRLLVLIDLVNKKKQPSKKMSTKDQAARTKAINQINRAKYKSKG